MWSGIRVLYFLLALSLGSFSGYRNDVGLRVLVGVGVLALFRLDVDDDRCVTASEVTYPVSQLRFYKGHDKDNAKSCKALRAEDAIISLLLYLAGFALYRYAHRARTHNA